MMPRRNDIDQFQTPIDLAVMMAQKQQENFLNQIVKPRQPQRQRRLGDMPADPIIESIVRQMPEG